MIKSIHIKPEEEGMVLEATYWRYSSAMGYYVKGLSEKECSKLKIEILRSIDEVD